MAFGGKVRVVRSIALAIILVMILGDFSFAIDRTARAAGMHERSKLAAELMQHAEKQDAALKSVNPLNPDPLGVRRKQVEQAQREELARRAGPNGKAVRGSTSAGMRQINPNDSNLSPELKKMIADMKSGKGSLNGANENIKATDSTAMMEQIKKAESPEIAKFLIEMYNESAKDPLTWKGLAELGLDVKAIKAAGLLLADEPGAPINSDNLVNNEENDNINGESDPEQPAADMGISFYNSALTSDLADSESAEAEISAKDLEAPIVEFAVDNSPASVESSGTETKNDEVAQSEPNAVGSLTGKKVESAEEISADTSAFTQNTAQTPAMTTESGVATKTGIAEADDMQYGAQRGNNALHSWRRARMEVGDVLNLIPYFRDISHKPGGMVVLTKVMDTRIASISGRSVRGLHSGRTQVTATVNGSFYVLPLEVRPKGTVAVPQVAAGSGHSIALKSDGSVWAWGDNGYGELGNASGGYSVRETTPMQVKGGESGSNYLKDIVAVSAGEGYSMALKANGTVWTWGCNSKGQLGIGANSENLNDPNYRKTTPVQVKGANGSGYLTDVVAVSAGIWCSMALKADGSVWTWGWGRFGESGTGELGSNIKTTPVRVKGGESGSNYLTDIVVVLIGKTHSMALKSNGSVWAWGMNRRGELGNGTKDHALTPVQVKGANGNGHLTNIVAVAAGKMYHSIALKSDGSVWAWGDGGAGQLGDGTSGQNVYSAIPVRVKGGESGSNYLTDIVAVSAGFDCSIALKSNGSVWTWGWNTSGQLGDGTSGTSLNPYLIRAYPVQVKGANGNGHLTDIAAVTAGEFHSMALNSDGSVWAWGNNSAGQLGNGMSGGNAKKSTPVEVSAQLLKLNYATIIDKNTAIPIEVFDKNNPMPSVIRIKANQKFKVDRSRITKYPGFNLIYDSTPVDPSKTSFEIMDGRIAAATSEGEVVSAGTVYGYTQLVIKEADSGFVRVIPIGVMPERAVAVPQVALGGHCIALKSDGSVWAWGLNIYGQLGDGTNTNKTTPVRVTGPAGYGNLMGVVAVSVGAWYSMALSTDGKVWTWGRNNYGQLADGTTESRNTPAWARGENGSGHLTGVVAISAGHSHSMALKADGTVWTWGRNDYGQIGDGTSAAISSNPHHKKVFPVQVKGANGIWKLTDIVAVAAGDSHSMALKFDGSVWTWGNNNDGQIGDGTASTKPNDPNYKKVLPVQVINSDGNGYLSDVVYVAPGNYYSMAIKSDRSVWTWGNNRYGQIGDGTAANTTTPVQVKGANGNGYLSDIVASAGKDHSIALKSDGSVWTWGLNRFGELGDGASGDDSSKVTPVQVKGAGGSGYLTDITAVAAGYYCSMAIKSNGSVWAWGSNGQGQLGDGTTTARTTPVEVSAQPLKVDYASIIDRNAGVPIEIFDENNPMPPVIRIKANQKFKVDRSKITRYPGFNLIYDSTPVNPSKTSFEITDGRIAVATSEGEVVPTGTAYGCTQLVVKDTESGIIRVIPIGVMPEGRVAVPQVASGESYNIALKADGTVWAWGCNEYGQLGNGMSGSGTEKAIPVQVKGAAGNGYLTNVVAVAAGDSHSMALKSDGSVWTWGRNNYGQIGNAASGDDMNETTPVQVKGVNGNGYLAGIVDIAIGYNHSMALKTDGTVWAWGRNARGELGNGTTTQSTVPVQVKGESGIGYLSDVVSIAAGADHSIALKSDGTVWAWGNGVAGQLGDGTSGVGVDKSTPVQVKGPGGNGYLTDVVAVAAGYNHSMALKTDGSVWAWGFNIYGQLGDGTNTNRTTPVQVKGPGGNGYLTDVVAVAAGRYHSMALKTDGSVWAWGYNYYGLIGDGTAANTTTPVQVKGASGIGYLSKVVAVAAGVSQNIVIKTDGSVWTWASNEYGQLGDDTTTYRATPVMVSDNKLQISPEQVTIYPSATEAFTASFKSFNLFNDGETPPGDYEWSIEDERDEHGIEKPGEILQFAIEGGHPIPGTVKGKGIGTAKVKVVNKATGHDAAFASVEVVALGGDRPLDIKVESDTANAAALENAVASNELDADEYRTITDPVSGAVVGYALHTDPAQGKVLKGIYTVLVHVEGVKGTVRVKSFINTDDICLEDKAGNAIPGVGTRKITDPDSPYAGYFEFTDVPLVKFISAYYLRFYNQGDNAITTNPNYYNGVYKLSITLYSEDNEEPMVEVDDNLLTKLNMGEAGYEGSYKYVLPAGKSEVKVQLTTSISGADVKIGDFESEHTSSTRNVTVDIDPETGVQNVVLSVHESGGAAVHNYKLILVSQDADTSLNKLEIKRIDGSIISDSYLPKYDFARNAYVVNVKDNAENVRIYAYPSNINAKAAVAADRAAALAAAGTVVVGTLDTPLQSGENRFYIAVTPSTHDSDMHYPKEVHELIINRMPANNEETLAHLKLVDETEEGDGLYELDPDFDANIENYEATVDPLAKSIEFEFTTNVPGARLNMTLGDQVFKSATGSLKNSFALALDTATFEAVFEVRVPADPGDPTSVPRYGRYRVLIKRDGVDAGDVASVQTSIMGTIKTYAENDHSATIRLYDKNGELVELDSAGNTEYQVGEDGIFEIKLPEAGEYKMLISKAGYLSYTVNDIVISETFVKAKYDFETISLGAGDLVDDGESKDVIDEADIEAAVTALEDTSAIDLAKYDLNGDGVFDGEDVNIISFNVGVTAFEVSNLDVDNVAHAILRRY